MKGLLSGSEDHANGPVDFIRNISESIAFNENACQKIVRISGQITPINENIRNFCNYLYLCHIIR